jgi:hypothetical protein
LNIAVPISPSARIVVDGIGGVRVGMTLAEAEASTKAKWDVGKGYESPGCGGASIPSVEGVGFMISGEDGPVDPARDRIVRVEVDGGQWATPRGIRVGDRMEAVLDAYPSGLARSPHAYVEGWYLDYVPTEKADSNYRLRFVIEGDIVRTIIAGFADAVRLIEGCS